eukprot:gene743-53864_t
MATSLVLPVVFYYLLHRDGMSLPRRALYVATAVAATAAMLGIVASAVHDAAAGGGTLHT